MAKLGIADELCELIKTVDVAPDELSMVVANYFGRAWIPGGREVFYGSEDEEVALRLTYARSGQLVAALAGPALTNQAAREAARLGPLLRDPNLVVGEARASSGTPSHRAVRATDLSRSSRSRWQRHRSPKSSADL
jgi:hypothetical protein